MGRLGPTSKVKCSAADSPVEPQRASFSETEKPGEWSGHFLTD
jgi:hypothetical protein